MFGLKKKDIEEIQLVLRRFPEVEKAFIFGSRAMGNYRQGSDVDIAIKGKAVTFHTTLKIAGILNEDTLMPYRFDVLGYDYLKNKELLSHIDRVGQLLYEISSVVLVKEPFVEYRKGKE